MSPAKLRPYGMSQFTESILQNQHLFRLEISPEAIVRLELYYEFIIANNEFLHLVAPCSAEEFATRHILESLTMLKYLPENTRFVDIGSGSGLPAIPCLLVREDLRCALIESKQKKADFLQKAIAELSIISRVKIINKQFDEVRNFDFTVVSCRALDKFSQKLPSMLKWSGKCSLLLFGGNSLRDALKQSFATFKEKLMPLSEQRYLFIVRRDVPIRK